MYGKVIPIMRAAASMTQMVLLPTDVEDTRVWGQGDEFHFEHVGLEHSHIDVWTVVGYLKVLA